MEKISNDIPKMITLDYIKQNISDENFKRRVEESYIDIIESFDDCLKTDVCIELGTTLMYNLDCHSENEETRRTYQIIIEICRIGINFINNTTDKRQFILNSMINSPNEALLNARIGMSLININRPIAAMEYLDRAEKLFEFNESMNNNPDEDWFRINYENCRA